MSKYDFDITSESGEKVEVSFYAEDAKAAVQDCANWADANLDHEVEWSIDCLTVLSDEEFALFE